VTARANPRYPRLLVTGGAGFIGSCFVRDLLARADGSIVTVLDKMTYAGNRANLASAESDPEQASRLRFVVGDIADAAVVGPLVAESDAVVNFAAESHVDRSILDPEAFLRTDVLGVHVLLEACRLELERSRTGTRRAAPRFLQVSTDEVYGSVETGESREDDRLEPRSPYSSAKAAGELLARSYFVTYGLDTLITRGSNTYGPYHHPEKLIPLFLTNAIDDQPLPMYGDGLQRRDWLYVADHAGAIGHVLEHGDAGEIYNIPGGNEWSNRAVIAELLERLGKPWSLVRTVQDRPGHDRRYAMDGSKLAALGWRNRTTFENGLATTVDWFRDNESWWRPIKAGEWNDYYKRQYEARLAGSAAAEAGGGSAQAAATAGSAAAGSAAVDGGSAHPGGAAEEPA
jgi:dTDP-glucose 4,6-dehydratase